MEIKTELKVIAYLEEMLCDVCEIGKMIVDARFMLPTHPPQYAHECNNCGEKKNYFKRYPSKSFDAIPFEEEE